MGRKATAEFFAYGHVVKTPVRVSASPAAPPPPSPGGGGGGTTIPPTETPEKHPIGLGLHTTTPIHHPTHHNPSPPPQCLRLEKNRTNKVVTIEHPEISRQHGAVDQVGRREQKKKSEHAAGKSAKRSSSCLMIVVKRA